MRVVLFALMCVGCSDYQVSKRSMDADEDAEPIEDTASELPPEAEVDTAEPQDTGDEGVVEEPPVEEPPADTGEEPPAEIPVEPIYVHTNSTLYSLDPATSTLSLVGDFYADPGGSFDGSMTDIAIDSDGNVYGIGFTGLFGIDPTNARVWDVAAVDENFVGLTATSDGRLIAAGDGLYEIDIATGSTTPLVDEGAFTTSGDIVGLPSSLLYWLVRSDDDSGDRLVEVDAMTGTNRVVGSVGVTSLYGVAYSGGSLYGFSDEGLMVEIDPSTATVLSEQYLSQRWWGAATNPVVWETDA